MFSGEQEVAVMGGPAGSAPMKNAVINIQTENPGRDHIVWSLFNTLFMNICCLGFVAFDYSVESKDQKMVGDITGAQSHASTAKCLNVWALVLGLLLTITALPALPVLLWFCRFLASSREQQLKQGPRIGVPPFPRSDPDPRALCVQNTLDPRDQAVGWQGAAGLG
uniref:Uncharacterized protein n=1 Tax=Bos indicus x Bos taurus TaxID=30522 RepID=A0A4W2BQE1_BOBOX